MGRETNESLRGLKLTIDTISGERKTKGFEAVRIFSYSHNGSDAAKWLLKIFIFRERSRCASTIKTMAFKRGATSSDNFVRKPFLLNMAISLLDASSEHLLFQTFIVKIS